MRFVNIMLTSMILSAAFGTALARHTDQSTSPARKELLSPSSTWLWAPSMRRGAPGH